MTKNRLNGTALRSILDTRGISISDLAKICGKNRALMSQWISGKRNPRRGEVQKIADSLRLNISEISDFSDDDFTAINLNIEDSIQEYRYIYEAAMSQLQKKVSECGQAKTAESIGVSGGYISLLLNEKAKISDIKLSAFLRLFPNIKQDFLRNSICCFFSRNIFSPLQSFNTCYAGCYCCMSARSASRITYCRIWSNV